MLPAVIGTERGAETQLFATVVMYELWPSRFAGAPFASEYTPKLTCALEFKKYIDIEVIVPLDGAW